MRDDGAFTACVRDPKKHLFLSGFPFFAVSHLMKMYLSNPSISLSVTVFVAGEDLL